jgi:hypothetical protein
VKLSVLALDYDGTIARNDRLDASVRDAIADARRRGVIALAREIQAYERAYLPARAGDIVGRIIGAISSRYELNEPERWSAGQHAA